MMENSEYFGRASVRNLVSRFENQSDGPPPRTNLIKFKSKSSSSIARPRAPLFLLTDEIPIREDTRDDLSPTVSTFKDRRALFERPGGAGFPLRRTASTNLECLKLQEINEISKKTEEIVFKVRKFQEVSSNVYISYLNEIVELLIQIGEIDTFGNASIQQEKLATLQVLQKCYFQLKDKIQALLDDGSNEIEEVELLQIKDLIKKWEQVAEKRPSDTYRLRERPPPPPTTPKPIHIINDIRYEEHPLATNKPPKVKPEDPKPKKVEYTSVVSREDDHNYKKPKVKELMNVFQSFKSEERRSPSKESSPSPSPQDSDDLPPVSPYKYVAYTEFKRSQSTKEDIGPKVQPALRLSSYVGLLNSLSPKTEDDEKPPAYEEAIQSPKINEHLQIRIQEIQDDIEAETQNEILSNEARTPSSILIKEYEDEPGEQMPSGKKEETISIIITKFDEQQDENLLNDETETDDEALVNLIVPNELIMSYQKALENELILTNAADKTSSYESDQEEGEAERIPNEIKVESRIKPEELSSSEPESFTTPKDYASSRKEEEEEPQKVPMIEHEEVKRYHYTSDAETSISSSDIPITEARDVKFESYALIQAEKAFYSSEEASYKNAEMSQLETYVPISYFLVADDETREDTPEDSTLITKVPEDQNFGNQSTVNVPQMEQLAMHEVLTENGDAKIGSYELIQTEGTSDKGTVVGQFETHVPITYFLVADDDPKDVSEDSTWTATEPPEELYSGNQSTLNLPQKEELVTHEVFSINETENSDISITETRDPKNESYELIQTERAFYSSEETDKIPVVGQLETHVPICYFLVADDEPKEDVSEDSMRTATDPPEEQYSGNQSTFNLPQKEELVTHEVLSINETENSDIPITETRDPKNESDELIQAEKAFYSSEETSHKIPVVGQLETHVPISYFLVADDEPQEDVSEDSTWTATEPPEELYSGNQSTLNLSQKEETRDPKHESYELIQAEKAVGQLETHVPISYFLVADDEPKEDVSEDSTWTATELPEEQFSGNQSTLNLPQKEELVTHEVFSINETKNSDIPITETRDPKNESFELIQAEKAFNSSEETSHQIPVVGQLETHVPISYFLVADDEPKVDVSEDSTWTATEPPEEQYSGNQSILNLPQKGQLATHEVFSINETENIEPDDQPLGENNLIGTKNEREGFTPEEAVCIKSKILNVDEAQKKDTKENENEEEFVTKPRDPKIESYELIQAERANTSDWLRNRADDNPETEAIEKSQDVNEVETRTHTTITVVSTRKGVSDSIIAAYDKLLEENDLNPSENSDVNETVVRRVITERVVTTKYEPEETLTDEQNNPSGLGNPTHEYPSLYNNLSITNSLIAAYDQLLEENNLKSIKNQESVSEDTTVKKEEFATSAQPATIMNDELVESKILDEFSNLQNTMKHDETQKKNKEGSDNEEPRDPKIESFELILAERANVSEWDQNEVSARLLNKGPGEENQENNKENVSLLDKLAIDIEVNENNMGIPNSADHNPEIDEIKNPQNVSEVEIRKHTIVTVASTRKGVSDSIIESYDQLLQDNELNSSESVATGNQGPADDENNASKSTLDEYPSLHNNIRVSNSIIAAFDQLLEENNLKSIINQSPPLNEGKPQEHSFEESNLFRTKNEGNLNLVEDIVVAEPLCVKTQILNVDDTQKTDSKKHETEEFIPRLRDPKIESFELLQAERSNAGEWAENETPSSNASGENRNEEERNKGKDCIPDKLEDNANEGWTENKIEDIEDIENKNEVEIRRQTTVTVVSTRKGVSDSIIASYDQLLEDNDLSSPGNSNVNETVVRNVVTKKFVNGNQETVETFTREQNPDEYPSLYNNLNVTNSIIEAYDQLLEDNDLRSIRNQESAKTSRTEDTTEQNEGKDEDLKSEVSFLKNEDDVTVLSDKKEDPKDIPKDLPVKIEDADEIRKEEDFTIKDQGESEAVSSENAEITPKSRRGVTDSIIASYDLLLAENGLNEGNSEDRVTIQNIEKETVVMRKHQRNAELIGNESFDPFAPSRDEYPSLYNNSANVTNSIIAAYDQLLEDNDLRSIRSTLETPKQERDFEEGGGTTQKLLLVETQEEDGDVPTGSRSETSEEKPLLESRPNIK